MFAISTAGFLISSRRLNQNEELWKIGKEVVVTSFKVLYDYSCVMYKEDHEACQYSQLAGRIEATDHYIVLYVRLKVLFFTISAFCWNIFKAVQKYLKTELYISNVISSYIYFSYFWYCQNELSWTICDLRSSKILHCLCSFRLYVILYKRVLCFSIRASHMFRIFKFKQGFISSVTSVLGLSVFSLRLLEFLRAFSVYGRRLLAFCSLLVWEEHTRKLLENKLRRRFLSGRK
jgi:hypothetical protein